MSEILLELDSRRRLPLAKLGVDGERYFLAERRADGTIVLHPATVRPKAVEAADRLIPGWESAPVSTETPQPSEYWESIKGEFAADGD